VKTILVGKTRNNKHPARQNRGLEKAHPCKDSSQKRKVRNHKYLPSQMVPAMSMVDTFRFRYFAPLVPWIDAELDRLHRVWLQVQRAVWRLPLGNPSAPLSFPSAQGGCPEVHWHLVVLMIQALVKHIEQLVVLPDELHLTTIRNFKTLCDSCGRHNEREIAMIISGGGAETRSFGVPACTPPSGPWACCGQLQYQIKLPASPAEWQD
jgi:hypothetical protein